MKRLLATYSNSVMTLVMLAVFLVLVGIASRYPAEARFMPFVVGIPPIFLCLLQLVLDARERRRTAAAVDTRSDIAKAQDAVTRAAGRPLDVDPALVALLDTTGPQISPQERVRREFILWGYFLGFIGGILLFGFWVAIPAFLVGFLRFQAKSSWRTALLLGLGTSIALFLVFEYGLKVQLHRGFIVSYALDLLG